MGRQPERKTVSLRTETAYKADESGKAAPHAKAPGSDLEVNAEAVQWPFAFLSGETSISCGPETDSGATGNRRAEGGGVSRGHSTAESVAGRPEPVGCASPCEPRPSTKTPYGRVEASEDSKGKPASTQADLL